MTDRSEKPAERSEKPAERSEKPQHWWSNKLTLVLLGVALILGIAAVYAIFHNDHWTADDQVGGVSLGHPDDWAREGTQDAATFSPLQLTGEDDLARGVHDAGERVVGRRQGSGPCPRRRRGP